MTRSERNRIAGSVFADVFARESNLDPDIRLELAIGAAIDVALSVNPAIAARIEERKRPTVVNEVAELLLWNRARRTIAAVALNHDLTTDVLLGRRVDAEASDARDEAYYLLARGDDPLSGSQIAKVFGRARSSVQAGIRRHAARAATASVRGEEVAHAG